jgi:hypothetical protein
MFNEYYYAFFSKIKDILLCFASTFFVLPFQRGLRIDFPLSFFIVVPAGSTEHLRDKLFIVISLTEIWAITFYFYYCTFQIVNPS